MTARPHVVDITEQNFEAEIVEASMTQPVLVDFWATWCGPCKTLGPVLEELAETYGGAFRLAKVDVDTNPMLAAQFGAQSVPMVFALFQGRLVDRFAGALPRQQLTRFIDSVLERCGVAPVQADAQADLSQASEEELEAAFRAKLEADGADGDALLGLGGIEMRRGQAATARALLEKVPAAATAYGAAQAHLGALGLLVRVEEAGGESTLRDRLAGDPDGAEARYLVACSDGARGRFATALEALVALVAQGSSPVRDPAKEAAAVLFEAAGRGDEEIEALRRRLTRLLF